MQRLSGFGLVFYALTMTFAGIDWIMSINPHWYSTLFGFLMLGGQGLSALAFTIITSRFLSHGRRSELLKPNHFHDLGKLSLAFVMLWAYFNFSQFLLTYAANLIEELPVFPGAHRPRLAVPGDLSVLFHFVVPFFCCCRATTSALRRAWSSWPARSSLCAQGHLHAGVARVRLAGRTCTCWRASAPSRFFVHWLDVAAPVAIGGLWVWMFARS